LTRPNAKHEAARPPSHTAGRVSCCTELDRAAILLVPHRCATVPNDELPRLLDFFVLGRREIGAPFVRDRESENDSFDRIACGFVFIDDGILFDQISGAHIGTWRLSWSVLRPQFSYEQFDAAKLLSLSRSKLVPGAPLFHCVREENLASLQLHDECDQC